MSEEANNLRKVVPRGHFSGKRFARPRVSNNFLFCNLECPILALPFTEDNFYEYLPVTQAQRLTESIEIFDGGPVASALVESLPKLQSIRDQIAKLQAEEHRIYSGFIGAIVKQDECDPLVGISDGSVRMVRSIVATAFNISERTVEAKLNDSHTLVNRFQATLDALESGKISNLHATKIIEAGSIIQNQEDLEEFQQRVLKTAERQTVARFSSVAKRVAEEYAAETIDERHAKARKQRGVRVRVLDDGLADITATLDATSAFAIKDRVDRFAKQAQLEQEERVVELKEAQKRELEGQQDKELVGFRNIDELRADVFEDIMLTSDPLASAGNEAARITGVVRITVPALTLMRDCELDIRKTGVAQLEGYGPIDTETARKLAAGVSVWERVLTDPVTGLVIAVDRYQPSQAMRRHLDVRDEHCRFPGCRRSVEHTDKDHTKDWQHGGKTEIANLASLCRGHHTLKHAKFSSGSRWRVKQKPGGDLEWVNPLGMKLLDKPRSTVAFKPVKELTEIVASPPPLPEEPAPY